MKQIIVVTNKKEQFENRIPGSYFHTTWCGFSVEELLKVRDRSNLIIMIMDHEDHDSLSKMGLYLRDACIEEEKMLYLYGNKEDVDTMTSLVPSMFIKKSMYSFEDFDKLEKELMEKEVNVDKGKPCCAIIDDDSEFVERLRLHLDGFFRVVVSRFDAREISELVQLSDVALVSVDGTLKLSEFMGLFHMLLTKKKTSRFRFYYLTPSNRDRDFLNIGIEESALSFSKQMDVDRIASFLINQYKNKG